MHCTMNGLVVERIQIKEASEKAQKPSGMQRTTGSHALKAKEAQEEVNGGDVEVHLRYSEREKKRPIPNGDKEHEG